MASDNVYEAWQPPARNTIVLVGTSSITISEQRNKLNPRQAFVFANNSPAAADIITLNFGGNNAVANAGIVLHQGDICTDSNSGEYDVHQGTITAICATANGSLSVFER